MKWYGLKEVDTVWRTRKALAEFESSPAYPAFHEGLVAAGGGPPPTTVYIDGGYDMIEAMLFERVSITTVYFPSPVTAEQKKKFYSIDGLVYGFSVGQALRHLRATRACPGYGWVDGVHEYDGRSYEMGIIYHFWAEEELEKTFRTEQEILGEGSELVVDKFARDLKEAGAERWTEVHCDFEDLPINAIIL
ncbi:MAG: hypothetical protein Q9168_003482 [Polycauliona sp. 1 TL-2023]